MKKILRILIFFILAIGLLFITEVNAATICGEDTDVLWSDLSKDQFFIKVTWGGNTYHRQTYSNADETANRRITITNISGGHELLSKQVDVFVYYRHKKISDMSTSGVKQVSGDILGFTQQTYGVGSNKKYHYGHSSFKLKNYGTSTVKVKLDTENGIDVDITLEFKVESAPISGGELSENLNSNLTDKEDYNLEVIIQDSKNNRHTVLSNHKITLTGNKATVSGNVIELSPGEKITVFFHFTCEDLHDGGQSFSVKGKTYVQGRTYTDGAGTFETKGKDKWSGWAYVTLGDTLKTKENIELKIFHPGGGSTVAYSITVNIPVTLSEERGDLPFEDIIANVGTMTNPGEAIDSMAGMNKFKEKVGTILDVITNIAIIMSVLMLTVLGVKYMMGSIEEKADYKKDMVPYLVGACLVFGISLLVKILQSLGDSINSI